VVSFTRTVCRLPRKSIALRCSRPSVRKTFPNTTAEICLLLILYRLGGRVQGAKESQGNEQPDRRIPLFLNNLHRCFRAPEALEPEKGFGSDSRGCAFGACDRTRSEPRGLVLNASRYISRFPTSRLFS
jgi:hypothetical protein